MRPGDLTTLDAVKNWLSIPLDDVSSDDLLLRLIASASLFVRNNISINGAGVGTYDELYDGNGQRFMLLRQWPVLDVEAIVMQGGPQVLIAKSVGNPRSSGWYLSSRSNPTEGAQTLYLWGYAFPVGRGTVNVAYTAGFKEVGEIHHIVTDGSTGVLPVVTFNTWVQDFGVTAEDGTPFLKVDSSPAVDQYSVDEDGVYTFNVANLGDTVLVSYGYVPADLEQAVIQLVGEGLKYKDRIGVKSKTLGGQETISYDNSFLTDGVKLLLNSYQRVAPI